MKKRIVVMFIVMSSYSLIPINATSGRLKNASITNCNETVYGQHGDGHWHQAEQNSNGSYNAVGNPISENPCVNLNTRVAPEKSEQKEVDNAPVQTPANNEVINNTTKDKNDDDSIKKKSSDTSIKSITVNKDSIEVAPNMTYETDAESITLNVILNDNKATIDYDEVIDLKKGLNSISLTVISEDNTEMIYKIEVTRNSVSSSNKNIEIKVNDEVIEFKDNKAQVHLTESSVTITYVLEDENALTSLDENIRLKDNTDYVISFIVVAEDQTIDNYELELISMATANHDFSVAITAIVFGLLGAFGMKYYIKYRGKKIKVKIEE